MACLFPGARMCDAYWRNILARWTPSPTRRRRPGTPNGYYDPDFGDIRPDLLQARAATSGPLVAFDPLAHGIPPVAVGGEPDQWLALQVAADALADAGYARAPTRPCAADGGHPRQGDVPERRQRRWRSSAAWSSARRSSCCKALHPEHTEEELEALRAELQRVAAAARAPRRCPG